MNMRPTDEQPDGHKHPDLDDVLSQIDEMESQWRQQEDMPMAWWNPTESLVDTSQSGFDR